jgi:hypothetical protein
MNIFKEFVLAVPNKNQLDFGYNHNVVIESVDIGQRKRNGIAVKSNTFVRLTKIDVDTKKPIASTEISFFDLDPTKDFVYVNFLSQFTCLVGIIAALGGNEEAYQDEVLAVLQGNSEKEMTAFLKKVANAKAVQDVLMNAFYEQVKDKTGLSGTLLKCKMSVNKSGFLEPGAESDWILAETNPQSLPTMSSRDKLNRQKSLEATDTKLNQIVLERHQMKKK